MVCFQPRTASLVPSLQCVDLKVVVLTEPPKLEREFNVCLNVTSGRLDQIRWDARRATFEVDFQRAGDSRFREAADVLEVVARVVGRPLGDEAIFGDGGAIASGGTSLHHGEDFPGHCEELSVGFRFFLGFGEFEGSGVSSFLGEDEVVGFGDEDFGGVGLAASGDGTVQDQFEVFGLSDLDVDFITGAVLLGFPSGGDFDTGFGDEGGNHSLTESRVPLLMEGVLDRAVEDVIGGGGGDKVFQTSGDLDVNLRAEGGVLECLSWS